jgi:hypothetical protein
VPGPDESFITRLTRWLGNIAQEQQEGPVSADRAACFGRWPGTPADGFPPVPDHATGRVAAWPTEPPPPRDGRRGRGAGAVLASMPGR